jgi:hypothetical protein
MKPVLLGTAIAPVSTPTVGAFAIILDDESKILLE